ncbi:hypothetical protein MesoLjLb_48400 [Mesorhizobium sp. L-8-3]|nr:hypothetical protein MesoLjLb_48400 [Mesorhizobium sp. L-8-3]
MFPFARHAAWERRPDDSVALDRVGPSDQIVLTTLRGSPRATAFGGKTLAHALQAKVVIICQAEQLI